MPHVDGELPLHFSYGMTATTQKLRYHDIGKWGRGQVRRIDLTGRDLAYLHALFLCGVLSTDMLHALVAPDCHQSITTKRMFLFRNPPNDHVVQPKAQENARNAIYANLIYEVSEAGVAALVDSGRITYSDYLLWKKLQANYRPQHFEHDFATGYILGSIALGARQVGIRFISSLEIINRSKCPKETRDDANPFAIPYESNDGRRLLIPDALFGLEYRSGACFFALETDMGTEQLRDSDLKKSTIAQKLKAYRTIIRDEIFKARFQLPSLQVLTVTPSIVRMKNMIEALTRLAGGIADGPTRAFLFKALPGLLRRSSAELLPPTGHMLTVPWERAQLPQCDIAGL